MSSFIPLTRSQPVNEKFPDINNQVSEPERTFQLLRKDDRAPSFSYSLDRISQKLGDTSEGFTPLTRALSFAHKGISANPVTTELVTQIGNGRVVIVVDTFSTGAAIVHSLNKQGFRVIRVLSGDLNSDLLDMVLEGFNLTYIGTLVYQNKLLGSEISPIELLISQIEEITSKYTDLPNDLPVESKRVSAVIAGAETGVELSDLLSERLHLLTNGTKQSESRRNKYLMGETVRNAGIRAVKQLKATNWEDINNFINDWQPSPFQVIVKPLDSAGSDGVTLCKSIDEVRQAFDKLYGKINGLGLQNDSVLVQEYLDGDEYVVDCVSYKGHHKVVAIWAYDRRSINGAGFVCFGQNLQTINDNRCRQIVEYQKRVITSLGILNGPTHGEVKWFKNEPILVEVGARCHGAEGAWIDLANESLGVNQVNATIDSYLHNHAFQAIPDVPSNRLAYSRMKYFVITKSVGILKEISESSISRLRSLQSYRGHEFFVKVGDLLRPTIDCFTWGGYIKLANVNEIQLINDYNTVEQLEIEDLFIIE
eukprot:gene19381-25249_t